MGKRRRRKEGKARGQSRGGEEASLNVTRRMDRRKESIVLNSNNNAEQRSTCDGSTQEPSYWRRLGVWLRVYDSEENGVEVLFICILLWCRYPVSSTSTPNPSFQFQFPTVAPPDIVQQGLWPIRVLDRAQVRAEFRQTRGSRAADWWPPDWMISH